MIRSALGSAPSLSDIGAGRCRDRSHDSSVRRRRAVPAGDPGLGQATGGAIERALASREIQGKPYELFLTPITSADGARRAWRSSAPGRAADFNLERLRRVATAAALAARQRQVARMAFLIARRRRPSTLPTRSQAITEGLMLAAFNGDRYKSQDRAGPAAGADAGRRAAAAATSDGARARRRARAGSSASRRTSRASSATSRRTSSRRRSSPSAARRSRATRA